MITRFKQQMDMPYCLHDMIVSKITCQNDSVHLKLNHRYVGTKEPHSITVENVDMDYACVLLLSQFGEYGDFTGKKMLLKDFMDKYDEYFFEIVEEMYGFNQVEYIGYLSFPNKDNLIQMSLSIYFTGDIVYEREER